MTLPSQDRVAWSLLSLLTKRRGELELSLRLRPSSAHREPRAQSDRLLERTGRRDAFSDDVERSAMRRRGEHRLEAAGDRDAAIEPLELGRDLSLVVIHREHAVELAAEGLEEHG